MDSVQNWTRDYFLRNEKACLQTLKSLTDQDKLELYKNLQSNRNGSLCLLNNMMIADIQEPEFYCERYEVKSIDGSQRTESGKFTDKLSIGENENVVDDHSPNLDERQVMIVSSPPSINQWVKDATFSEIAEGKSFIVKAYGSFEFKINSLIEVIGFLFTENHTSSVDFHENGMETDSSNEQPKTTGQSSIHAVLVNEIKNINPILHEPTSENEAAEIQKDLLKLLKEFSFGDEVAAHYILLHLISRVYGRVEEEILGKFSINLVCSSIPRDVLLTYGKMLYDLIELLVPNSVYLPLTIENFNTKAFVPKKDYKTNRLEPGLLQLPNHTHLMLDETQRENGKLEAQGCIALHDLSELITKQELQYDFQFYKLPFRTDLPTMTISEGKSLLPADFVITIKPDSDSIRLVKETFEAGLHFIKPKLNNFRRYLSQCRYSDFVIGELETKTIETDFVKMRGSSYLQVEHLHSLIVVSRLLGISKGQTQFDLSSWEAAKVLETERMTRVESLRIKK